MEKPTTITADKDLDEEKILRQSQSDPEAFRPIYEKYFKKIFLFVMHRVGEKETAADLTQQVFVKAMTGLRKFQFRGLPFSAWLYRIAINECNSYFRKAKGRRCVVLEENALQHLHEEMTSENQLEDLERRLPSILQRLPEKDLYLIELRFFEGRAFKEIGDILGTTEVTAKIKTYRILAKMRKYFFQP